MKQWVIDTWVLATSNSCDSAHYLDCVSFLMMVLQNGTICLDSEKEIQREYYTYIKPGTFLDKWWQKIMRQTDQIRFFSNKLNYRNEIHLLNNLGFDRSDVKFVGVASRTADNLLVTGDSDYTDNIRTYLRDQLMIIILHPTEAKNPDLS